MIDLNALVRDARKYNPHLYKNTNGWEYYFTLDFGTFPEYDDFQSMVEFISDNESNQIKFDNDSRVGSCGLTAYELWNEIFKIWKEVKFFNHCGLIQKAKNNKIWIENILNKLGWEWNSNVHS